MKELRNAEQDLSLCEAATKGERLTRVDADYYQGGIYIGVVPKKMGGSDYFETDLFRIEGANNADERLAREAQIILPYWIRRCASLQAENEKYKGALEEIADYSGFQRKRLQPGHKLDGHMIVTAMSLPSTYTSIARAALTPKGEQ